MEETLLHGIFGVDKSYQSKPTALKDGVVFVPLELKEQLLVCPGCGSRDVIRKERGSGARLR